MNNRTCLECGQALMGRKGQKYCSGYCKSAHHYEQHKEKVSLFKKIDKQLKLNHKILRLHNKVGKTTLRKSELHDAGFNPNYFTHYWKNKNGQVYLFCYDYGFLAIQDNHQAKYLIVTWQPYMNKPHLIPG